MTRSAAIPHRLSEFIGNQSENKLSEMHAKIMVRPQIAWSDALRACIPKCMQIVHTLDPRGMEVFADLGFRQNFQISLLKMAFGGIPSL